MKKNNTWLVHVLLVVLLIMGLAACQTPAGRSMGQVVDDSTISTEVKAKLFKDTTLSGFAVTVQTFEGTVTLIGAVDNTAQKERAREIAQEVRGVRKVNNLPTIKSSK
jgi:hyperosmotically inducible protein